MRRVLVSLPSGVWKIINSELKGAFGERDFDSGRMGEKNKGQDREKQRESQFSRPSTLRMSFRKSEVCHIGQHTAQVFICVWAIH